MRTYPLLALLLAFILVAGCSSSRDLASSEEAAGRDTAAVEERTPAASRAPVPDATTAPEDWLHRDPEASRFPGASIEKAYRTFLEGKEPKREVVVAVIDGGVDVEHEDLRANLWTNDDEVPDNGEDDDGNGYVDDVHGWNFIGGPDGEDVNHDTYELTRLYDELADRFANADTTRLSPKTDSTYARYLELEENFQQKRQETEQLYTQVQQASQVVTNATSVLEDHLSIDTLSQEQVASIESNESAVLRAQEILLYFYDQGLSPEDINAFETQLKNDLEYGYNRDFNPRPIVGDDADDLSQRIYGNSDVTGPDAEHGTIVAGIIAAQRDNGIGVDGIAEGVRIMSIRAVPNGDERDKDVANAIRYAVDNGADVINMSFGKSYSPHKKAVDAAVRYADERGVLMVHAAGNDGANIDTTDSYPSRRYVSNDTAAHWLEVGASSWEGGESLAAPFSNYGAETVDVFAPGVAIHSTTPNQTYDSADGTSMAAPVVSGLAALIMAHYPDLTAGQVRQIIRTSAVRYPDQPVTTPGHPNLRATFSNLSSTGGIVNAYRAFQKAEQLTE